MAYMSQERKAQIAPAVKAILAKYGVKGSLSVDNHSTLVLNIKSGPLDFIGNTEEVCKLQPRYADYFKDGMPKQTCIQVNPYWYQKHFSGVCKDFLTEVLDAMNVGNHNNSDIQTDYFDVGWYVNVNIGRWASPYKLVTA